MIRAFFADTAALRPERAEEIISHTPALAGVIDARLPERRLESAAGYILLAAVMSRLGYSELPRVLRAEGGKPYFADCPVRFSLSHRPGAALLLVSDECEVGADVEIIADDSRMARLAERYLVGKTLSTKKSLECDITLCTVNERAEVVFIDCAPKNEKHSLHIERKSAPDMPYLAWTLLEAALKVGGGGFGDLSRFGEIISTLSAAYFVVSTPSESWAVSLAAKK